MAMWYFAGFQVKLQKGCELTPDISINTPYSQANDALLRLLNLFDLVKKLSSVK